MNREQQLESALKKLTENKAILKVVGKSPLMSKLTEDFTNAVKLLKT